MQTSRCGKPKANPEFAMRHVECDTGLGSAGPSTHVHTHTHTHMLCTVCGATEFALYLHMAEVSKLRSKLNNRNELESHVACGM